LIDTRSCERQELVSTGFKELKMEPFNLIVIRDLIQNHKETRVKVAIPHKDRINAERETAHMATVKAAKAAGTAEPPVPATVNNTSEEVAQAVYQELLAKKNKYPKCVENYNELAKKFDTHNKKS